MSKHWNINKALSYNASIVMVAGARSIGKTYTTLKHCVKRFIKHGEECVYIRRYEPELKAVKKYVFSDVATDKEFKDYVFRLVGSEYQIAKRPKDKDKPEWRTFCYLLIASRYQDYKGVPFPKVKYIVWDEYLRENNRPPGYLVDEVGAILSLLITISRKRQDVTFFLLTNSCNIVNPLFRFCISATSPKRVILNTSWAPLKMVAILSYWLTMCLLKASKMNR